jgi:hypothetical protein
MLTQEDRRTAAEKVVNLLLEKGFFQCPAPDYVKGHRKNRLFFYWPMPKMPNSRLLVVTGINQTKKSISIAHDTTRLLCHGEFLTHTRAFKILTPDSVLSIDTPDIRPEDMSAFLNDAYKRLIEVPLCPDCNAPMTQSKQGTPYCADMCWLSKGRI